MRREGRGNERQGLPSGEREFKGKREEREGNGR